MKAISKIYTWLIFIFLYAPIVVLMVFSFNDSKSRVAVSYTHLDVYKRQVL